MVNFMHQFMVENCVKLVLDFFLSSTNKVFKSLKSNLPSDVETLYYFWFNIEMYFCTEPPYVPLLERDLIATSQTTGTSNSLHVHVSM